MQLEKKKLEWLDYDSLEDHPGIVGRTFLRHGGTSSGAFATLNLSDAVGDHPDCVKVNRSLIQKSLEINHLAFAKQHHEDKIFKVTLNNYSKMPEADGIYTKEKGLGLVVTHADCQAGIFYDPINQIIGAVHVGWRGLMLFDIYKNMVDAFVSEGAHLEDIIVCVSPSLGPEKAEFKNYKTELPKEFWDFQSKPTFFNLWDIARYRLTEAGIHESNIELVETCTFSNPKDYYSYRRDKITGRHGTVIVIK